jgi:hypothetical protein
MLAQWRQCTALTELPPMPLAEAKGKVLLRAAGKSQSFFGWKSGVTGRPP